MTDNDVRAEDITFTFRKKENGKCECEIDGKVYPCSSFKEAMFIFTKNCIKKGELQ